MTPERASAAATLWLSLCVAVTGFGGCYFDLDPSKRKVPDGLLDGAGPDRSTDTDGVPDAAGDQSTDPLGAFGPAQRVASLGSAGDEGSPALTDDLLEIYFVRDGDIWSATRGDPTGPFSALMKREDLSSGETERGIGLAGDGLTIYLGSARSGATKMDIFTAARTGQAWSAPVPVLELSSSDDDTPGSPTPDLRRIAIAVQSGDGGSNLFLVARNSPVAQWNKPAPLAPLNSPDAESAPWIDASASLIVFARKLGDGSDWDLMAATRAGGSYSRPVPVRSLNTEAAETDPWLSADLKTIYFSRSVAGKGREIFFATRPGS